MKKTILLVDDEIDIQNRYFLQAGYDVLVAHDCKEGLELFRKKSIDVIITDIMMPNMNVMILSVRFNILLLINPFSLQLLKQASRIRFMD